MTINVVGLVVLLLFYIVILVVGIVAARRKKKSTSMTAMESSIVAGRDISTAVGIFTMTGKQYHFNKFALFTILLSCTISSSVLSLLYYSKKQTKIKPLSIVTIVYDHVQINKKQLFLCPIYGHYVLWSVGPFVRLSVCLSVCPFVRPSVPLQVKVLVKVVFDEVEVQSTSNLVHMSSMI